LKYFDIIYRQVKNGNTIIRYGDFAKALATRRPEDYDAVLLPEIVLGDIVQS